MEVTSTVPCPEDEKSILLGFALNSFGVHICFKGLTPQITGKLEQWIFCAIKSTKYALRKFVRVNLPC
jgi:hypothetical protein